jgi:hypothetical protein
MSNKASASTADHALSSNEFYARVLSNQSVFAELVLQDQWGRDPTQKRKHKKVHGKISFASLTKLISANWQVLPDPVKEVFRDISARDSEHCRWISARDSDHCSSTQDADTASAIESIGREQP